MTVYFESTKPAVFINYNNSNKLRNPEIDNCPGRVRGTRQSERDAAKSQEIIHPYASVNVKMITGITASLFILIA